MKIEQLVKSKSKEEIAFLLYNNKNDNYKINCLECQFYQLDKYKIWKCSSFLENECRKEYYNWLDKEMRENE